MKKILLIEDNESILKGLIYSLEQERFLVDVAKTIEESKKLDFKLYDLIILDITLPDGNGFELCKYLKSKCDTPIMFLTAKDEEKDVVLGFDLGADEYIIKPFRIRELISRINNILRRYEKEEANKISSGNVEINLDAKRVYIRGKEVVFTA